MLTIFVQSCDILREDGGLEPSHIVDLLCSWMFSYGGLMRVSPCIKGPICIIGKAETGEFLQLVIGMIL